ncbi:SDR family NAD(P)-dependent oxidoreductase [Teredinibacter purpureus]|uniref:SDR family NAD(P)-dependent oxidoreductase n=1 Tax=Teredinibacter purpureus TaxID=2731756 RepID=UPI0005F78992|nr:SDR family NAD(P)-dependent oxidoreductase [Teredinibacter purpureus]
MLTNECVVAITGATAGIGRACVDLLMSRGIKVIALGRRTDRLNALTDLYGSDKLLAVTCDVRDEQSIQTAIDNIPSAFRPVSTLINNAGLIQGSGSLDELDSKDIEAMLLTNIFGVVNMTRLFLPDLYKAKSAHVVNVSSIGAFYHYKNGHIYAASKAFVQHFGRCLSVDLAEKNVRVTNIAPGKTVSEFSLVHKKGDTELADKVYENLTPLTADDVAKSIIWAMDQPNHVQISTIELSPANQVLSYR